MKVRAGFVSNSSSSSFLMMIREKDLDRIYETLHPFEQWVTGDFEIAEKFGEKFLIFLTEFHSEDGYFEWEQISECSSYGNGPEYIPFTPVEYMYGGYTQVALLSIADKLGGKDSENVLIEEQ